MLRYDVQNPTRTNPHQEHPMRDQFTNFTGTAATTLAENLDTASERALDAVIEANRKLVEFAVTTADRVAEQISFELPFADRLPTPAASGERYLEFVERAVAVNRDFNDRIVAMLKDDAPTAATAAASTVKTTATKVAAKTTAARKTAARKVAAKTTAAKKTAAKKTAAKTTAE